MQLVMLHNYWKIALRHVYKHRIYTGINVIGLATGMACFLLILLFVRDELSYDRFHEKADRIYRLTTDFGDFGKSAMIPGTTAASLAERYPEIEAFTRFTKRKQTLSHNGAFFEEKRFLYADASVFEVFDFRVLTGDPATVLSEPNTLVLTPVTAQRYFGNTDPIGQSLTLLDGSIYRITGLVEAAPTNSHIQFDMLASFVTLEPIENPWQTFSHSYVLLPHQEAQASLQTQLDTLTTGDSDAVSAVLGWWLKDMTFALQPITAVHLSPDYNGEIAPTSDPRYLYIFSGVALLILLIACINYMNLATARSARRAREVGVRKVLGAHQGQVRRQFIAEAVLLAGIALVVAIMLVELALPVFNTLSGKTLTSAAYLNPMMLGAFVALAVGIGVLAGSYPAFFLARFKPVSVLKAGGMRSRKGQGLRQALVVFQFGMSIALIVGTLIIQSQLDFMQNKRLGYQTEQIVQITLRDEARTSPETFKQQVLALPSVEAASLGQGTPLTWWGYFNEEDDGSTYQVRRISGDHDYVKTLGMEIVAGRDFSTDFSTDAESGVLLNETAARLMNLEDKVGETVEMAGTREGTLVGIVRDFHTASLHEPITATIISIDFDEYRSLLVRIQPEHMTATLEALETTWTSFVPDAPFTYTFFDEAFENLYRAEQRLGQMVGIFSVLAVLIACLGLFGLAAFTAEQRTKEIGVRKVLGASVAGLIALLTRDFVKLLAIAFMLAMPLAYLVMEQWLQAFAYRVSIEAGTFVLAGVAALGVALLTVSYQAIKAARANPIDSLRYE